MNWTTEDAEKAQAKIINARVQQIRAAVNEAVCSGKQESELTGIVMNGLELRNSPHNERATKTAATIGERPERGSGAAMAQPQTATQRTQALGRLKKGVMNNTERAYARHLEALKFAGEVMDYWFEEIKFKIGTSACWYEPDFLVQVKSGALEIHEIKGGGGFQDDALVKTKSLALRYPFRVISATLVKGNWEIREFN